MRHTIFVVLMCLANISLAQDTTAIIQDTTTHSVKKAVIFSAVVPGAGQVYNHMAMPKGQKRAYWKVPLIYTGLAASSYFLITNNQEQKALKEEYTNRTEQGIINLYPSLDNQGVLTLYNQHLNYRDLSILALLGVYVIQVVDAGVEAHFVNFDISKDLSINMQPTLLQGNTAGLSLRFNFR